MLARIASALHIPAVIIELRVFEWREELANKGRSVKRLTSQVMRCSSLMLAFVRLVKTDVPGSNGTWFELLHQRCVARLLL